MKIGFDAKRAAQNRTGLGNYSRFVLRILSEHKPENGYHLYIPDERRTPYLNEIPTLAALKQHFPAAGIWRGLRSIWRIWGVTADIRRDGMDIFHGLSNELPLNITRAGCKTIVTIHDLIFVTHPQYYHLVDRLIYGYKFKRACRLADKIIAVSEYTKQEIMRIYGTPAEKISVVYQGCDPVFAQDIASETLKDVKARYNLPERYILYVGSIEERKNLMLVARALAAMKKEGNSAADDIRVVAVGRHTAYEDRIKRFLADNGLTDAFMFHNNVPYADLPSFYKNADAFVYPSRIEGFGIPLLEAVSAGLPAIGCTGSCLEEAGGPGSIYTRPDDDRAMADAITRVWSDAALRQKMGDEGRKHAEKFTDDRLFASLYDVYKAVTADR
ncbi:MAG: glycosyltransferase family 4 protein [Prevotella sp.]|nr:glycosyltransferase family 4 protein [Prevotella sp.]